MLTKFETKSNRVKGLSCDGLVAFAELHQLQGAGSAPAIAAAPTTDSPLAQALAPLAPSQRRAHAEAAVLRVVRELAGASAGRMKKLHPNRGRFRLIN